LKQARYQSSYMVASKLGQQQASHSLPCSTEDGPVHASPRGKKRKTEIVNISKQT